MTKKITIIVSILLIVSSVAIEILINFSKAQINESIGFFAGFFFVIGVILLVKLAGKKKYNPC